MFCSPLSCVVLILSNNEEVTEPKMLILYSLTIFFFSKSEIKHYLSNHHIIVEGKSNHKSPTHQTTQNTRTKKISARIINFLFRWLLRDIFPGTKLHNHRDGILSDKDSTRHTFYAKKHPFFCAVFGFSLSLFIQSSAFF